ncbi:hypothetical protein [Roseivirga sp.]|uniref:hypothetical protein n=1 Tax=Roseivirga sp. TaxID=1964215 RepID=UPI003B52860E
MNKLIRKAVVLSILLMVFVASFLTMKAQTIETTGKFDRHFRVSERPIIVYSIDAHTDKVSMYEMWVKSYDCDSSGTNCMDIKVID